MKHDDLTIHAEALASALRTLRERALSRAEAVATLRTLGLTDEEAHAVVTHGVQRGLLGEHGDDLVLPR